MERQEHEKSRYFPNAPRNCHFYADPMLTSFPFYMTESSDLTDTSSLAWTHSLQYQILFLPVFHSLMTCFCIIAPACSRVRYRRPIFCPSVCQHLCRRSTFMSKLVF